MTEVRRQDAAGLPRSEMLLVGSVVLAISIGAFLRIPLLPSIGDELSMSPAQLGLITTVFGIGRLVTDIPAGRLADRAATLRALGLAGGVLATGSLVLAFAQAPGWTLIAAFALGIASSISNTTGMTYFSTAVPARLRGSSMAAFSAALLGGQSLGPMVGGSIAGLAGWRIAVGAAVLIGLAVAVFGMTCQRWRGRTGVSGSPPRAEIGRTIPAAPVGPDTTPRLQRAMLYSVAFSSFFMMGSMPQTLVPIIGDDEFGLSAAVLGLALGFGGVCRFIGAVAGGRLADRVSRKASLVPGMALGASGVAVFALDLGVAGWALGIMLFSLGSYGVSVAATMLADHAGGNGVGRRLGSYRFVGDIGLIVGPTVSGAIYERAGGDAAVLTVASLLAAVTVLSALFLRETRWLEEPKP